ncbi:MAG: trans-2,3-dihydro-3-hydroxyanthranilate isomerase [Gaiellaceae bacterium]|jgi:trans-2,3-dihydro-3-hydroxyanthranilate isomerase|nr:trans-2,3-dihydro-3-hydroxyanthranilate isomerase [Gaiellaceae bacterium]
MPGTYRYVVADVFTDTPLAGNQLAVFTDARNIPDELLQPLAKEMAFSETVFVYPTDAEAHVRIRIFTPATEIPFAGHPTLGTAFVLAQPMQLEVIAIETGSGVVPVWLEREGPKIVFGRMHQPIPRIEPFDEEPLLAALDVERSELPVELYDNGMRFVYVALRSEDEVAALDPDSRALGRLGGFGGVNCFAGSGDRWKSRMFAPHKGVPEDPATGSAAGPLAVHLARHGRIGWGDEITISQGVEVGRPSTLYARADGSADAIERVEVGGSAVVVARGEFKL